MAKSYKEGLGRIVADIPVPEYLAFRELAKRLDLNISHLVRRAFRAEMSGTACPKL